MGRLPLLLLSAALAGAPVHAAPVCRATSGAQIRPLVELYTSEGCDSCPPAERWLAAHFRAADPGQGAVALAFHVDYWDRLGWVDRFADRTYTARQYDAMRANGASFVYTPQVLLQGRDFAGWRAAGAAEIAAAMRKPAAATLTLEVQAGGDPLVVRTEASVPNPALARDARLFVVYADSGLVSEVAAGENRGARLVHDHVVRALRAAGAPGSDGRVDATIRIARPREAGIHPMLVAFVQRTPSGEVLQTLALPLDNCRLR